MHPAGFTVEIHYDAQPYERRNWCTLTFHRQKNKCRYISIQCSMIPKGSFLYGRSARLRQFIPLVTATSTEDEYVSLVELY